MVLLWGVAACQSLPTEQDVGWRQPDRPPQVPAFLTVQRGDSVYGLAQRYNLPMQAIIDANDLQPPYTLLIGQYLKMPRGRFHTVRPGETLSGIASAYGLDTGALAQSNEIEPPYLIRIGEWLRIPEPEARGTDGSGPVPAPVRPEPGAQAGGSGAGTSGESAQPPTPEALPADRTGPSVAARAPDETADGEATALGSEPASRPLALADLALVAPAGAAETRPAGETGAGTSGPGSEAGPAESVASSRGPEQPVLPRPPVRKTGRFGWPVRGPVLAGFGPQSDGQHNDGINVGAGQGDPVRASDYGVVAYAGDELRGFGNLVLVRHADGWISAYGHLESYVVAKGDALRRGQVLGRAGRSGAVSRPQVHFELRKGRRAVDPLEHLTELASAPTG